MRGSPPSVTNSIQDCGWKVGNEKKKRCREYGNFLKIYIYVLVAISFQQTRWICSGIHTQMVIIEQKPLFYHTVGRYVYSENSDEYSLKMAFARGRSRSFRTYTLYSLTIVCGAHINSFFRSASHHHTRTRAPYKFIASLDHPHTPVTPQQKRQPPLILDEENCCLWSAHPDA